MLRVAEQFAHSDTGRQRRGNEDAYLEQAPLFVVADGMGGAQGGEVASQIAIERFADGLQSSADGDAASDLADIVAEANAEIYARAAERAELTGMGTTLTAAFVGETEVSFAHVGDSRAYRFHDGVLERLTDDHSLVGEMIRQGQLTPAEAEEHPQRSIITRALGPEPEVAVDMISLDGGDGDVFLLCSDGLTSMVPEAEVQRILAGRKSLADAGRALINAANKAGGRDNITVVLFRLEEVGGGTPALSGTPRRRSRTPVPDEEPPATAEQALAAPGVEEEAPAAAATPSRLAPRRRRLAPRMPASNSSQAARRLHRRRRRITGAIVALAVVGVLAAGVVLAVQAVYFIGTDRYGQVTIYNGLPYTLPGGIKLYTEYFVSGVTTAELGPGERRRLFNNELRSQARASSLVKALELDQVQGQGQ